MQNTQKQFQEVYCITQEKKREKRRVFSDSLIYLFRLFAKESNRKHIERGSQLFPPQKKE